ncbi:PREDICTED: pyrin isoform X2 [Propithecus coquereli]|uniref:pyrin isoform X2 n=1 Tax=Propithecus coquereli TaxID=379532 RepID=UPI00063FCD77|nr:PREDICTED: pyrin isoform X2 [Propithecus coquereli]
MVGTLSDHLLSTLEELVPYDLEKFKFKLQTTSLEKEHSRIPWGQLQTARPVKVARLLVAYYGEEYAVRLTLQVLRAINQRLVAEELHRLTGQEYPIPESGTDSSTVSCSAAENKLKSLKITDCPDGDQGSDAACPASGQPEAGWGPLRKPLGKRRDPKAPEGLEALGRPLLHGAVLLSRRGSCPGKGPGLPEVSARLRRNASSAGNLQGLCSGAPGRRESKKYEVYLPSGKKRPKSLEFTIPSEARELSNPETLQIQEEMRTANPDSAATCRGVATVDVGATAAREKGSRNPEHSVVLQGGTLRNTLSDTLLAREEKATVPWEKNGTGGRETPETMGKMVGTVLHESSNPESSGSTPGKASSPLCHAQEGDPVGGCVQDSCSCPGASGESKASGSHSPRCTRCQARKNSGSLSPQPLPQCKRHMQVQLLFCEDHGEPICLICRLSQEHRGHQVRLIEEVALEYKEQIQKQLEHLQELRKHGEEQRSQGDKKTAYFLKQIEIQKQRARSQVEQLCKFLEQQEKVFVAWLEELGQTIGQVREAYGTRVSQDIALLDSLIGELEAKQRQSEWELLQDIGATLHRAKTVPIPELWATPPEMKEKMHLFYKKSEFVEKSMRHFLETLRSEMETFNVNVILDAETAHPKLIFSDDLKSVRLGNKWEWLSDAPERFDNCIIALGSLSFLSGCYYWEVEVGDKTAWVLGVCKSSLSRKGSITLTPENGYWVVMMMKRNEYQASTCPPIRLLMKEPPRRVGIFLDFKAREISFYNVTARSHIYTFTSVSSSTPLQPIFSPGMPDGGKNMGPLTICPVNDEGPH